MCARDAESRLIARDYFGGQHPPPLPLLVPPADLARSPLADHFERSRCRLGDRSPPRTQGLDATASPSAATVFGATPAPAGLAHDEPTQMEGRRTSTKKALNLGAQSKGFRYVVSETLRAWSEKKSLWRAQIRGPEARHATRK